MTSRLPPPLFALLLVCGCEAARPDRAEIVRAEPPRPVLAPAPPASARTAAEFDTTTPQQRAEATQITPGAEEPLGTTVASLGDPTEGGFWLRTPLVTSRGPGRVEVPEGGASVLVELIPAEGGSRISLAAMRQLDVPLTALPTVSVYLR